jgi:hypothetical protein
MSHRLNALGIKYAIWEESARPSNSVWPLCLWPKRLGTPHDVADTLGQMETLCRAHDMTKPAEQADAILPAWFYLFGAEAWSNCRSLLGVKFLIHAPDSRTFESFVREWGDCGDLFIYHPAPACVASAGLMSFRGMTRCWPWSICLDSRA